MDLFDGSDDSDGENGEEMPRSAACGVLQFHNGTEDEMLRVVAAEAPPGDVSATLAVIDRFCRSRHWMMHVGDVKGAILRAAAARRMAPLTSPTCIIQWRLRQKRSMVARTPALSPRSASAATTRRSSLSVPL